VTEVAIEAASGTVAAFLERLASASPDAGGGAAAALTAATAAALVTMVAGITARLGGPSPEPSERALADVADAASALRAQLLALIDVDIDAYRRVLDAQRRRDPGRAAAVRDELQAAARPPLAVARAGAALLEHCASLAPRARTSTVADLGTAAALADAALTAAALTARVNLAALGESAAPALGELDELLARGATLRQRITADLARRRPGAEPSRS
jgi:formiminotetrahydrofolate cyclodeaminase